ncbi:glycoside hydrolase family 2 protein [Faecalibacterium prausnitzii]|uniref:glycoside hydrolase family 2 protein n=1 Tax=Faecalibacterium prausnitzii TaxID=853 RepID=UPI003C30C678
MTKMQHPLPEYPRPALRRDSFESLNGLWQFAITKSAQLPRQWEGDILVPYSPETRASGVGRTLQPGQWLHYHCTFAPPAGSGGRVLLHFGAVDDACAVQVNGHLVGGHRGGYWPFTFDITEALNADHNRLWVAVQDPTGAGVQARGKQTLRPGGMFYPAQSGIWQTVWLERVPENYIQSLTVTPDYDARTVTVRARTAKPGGAVNLWAVVRAGGVTIAEDWGSDEADRDGEVTLNIPEEHFFPWSPDSPFLYDLTVGTTQGEEESFDTVHSYFALRKWSCEPDARGVLRFCLNGKLILLNGLLDQGYWPQGLYTPPSDAAVVHELQTIKELGFNLLRKHAKIEPQRWYYHCDRLGLVVWQDMVNGGSRYNLWFVTYLTNVLQPLLRKLPDTAALRGLLSRRSEASREEYGRELEATVEALRGHPCIGCWVPFNEGWGQFDAAQAVETLRALDPDRLVDEASGWYDQGGGDVCSIHNYFYPLHLRPGRRTVALSEYGGIAWPMPGHEPPRRTYGYGTAKSRADLTGRYRKLQLETVLPQLRNGLSALVYTQLTDVEDEVNGLFTYDRQAIKPDPAAVRAVNEALEAEFEKVLKQA